MLAIRLQRLGRKAYPVYRIAVQESKRHPSSGRVVAYVGSYNPHTKAANVQVELVQKYLDNGAQPTPRVVKLMRDAGVKLPKWVVVASADKQKSIKNTDKLRRNRPAEEVVTEEPAVVAAPEVADVAAEPAAEVVEVAEEPVAEVEEIPAEPVAEAEKAE